MCLSKIKSSVVIIVIALLAVLMSFGKSEAVYFTIENTGQYSLQWIKLRFTLNPSGSPDYYVSTPNATAPSGFSLNNYSVPLPVSGKYTSPTIPALVSGQYYSIDGYDMATWFTPNSGSSLSGGVPQTISANQFQLGGDPGYNFSAKITFYDGNSPVTGSGTSVPVMEGWWLLPGMLAGVGFFVRRRKE